MLFKVKSNFNDFLQFVLENSLENDENLSVENSEYSFDVMEKKQLLACGYFDVDKSDASYVLTYCDPFYVEEVNAFVKSALIDIELAKLILEFINE